MRRIIVSQNGKPDLLYKVTSTMPDDEIMRIVTNPPNWPEGKPNPWVDRSWRDAESVV